MPRRKKSTAILVAFGENMRALRVAKGMSLLDLGRVSGLAKGHLSSIEHGRTSATVDTCVRIAAGLGVAVAEMFPKEIALPELASEEPDGGGREDGQKRE